MKKVNYNFTLFVFFCCLFLIILQPSKAVGWSEISTGWYHSVSLSSDSKLYTWGNNNFGQLGINQGPALTPYKTSPIQVGTDNDWSAIATGGNHTIALKSNGSLWAWGRNDYGQLGINQDPALTPYIISPAQVGTDNDWVAIATGGDLTVALKSGGTLWTWGRNDYGQLGINQDPALTPYIVSPAQVGTDIDWTSIATGGYHTIALKSNGSLWAWGFNFHGQLGDNTNIDKWFPVRETHNDIDWTSITAGGYHTLALKSNGSLWAWGMNWNGQLGDNTIVNKSSPTRINDDIDWTSVAAGAFHSMAIKSNGSLWSWGLNSSGQLGDNSKVTRLSPVNIGIDLDWALISPGGDYSSAIKSDGGLWSWGSNIYGQLGVGSEAEGLIPTAINNPPIVNAGGTYSTVEGVAIVLDGTGSSDADGTIILYEWDIDNDGSYDYSNASPTQSHIFNQDDVYIVSLRVTDNLDAKSQALTSAAVTDTTPVADFSASPTNGIAPQTINFSNSSTGHDQPLSYAWDFDNDGSTDSTAMNPSYLYNNSGTYTVGLAVTDSDGSNNTLIRTGYITLLLDSDADGFPDGSDNCALTPNPAQENTDGDAYGNICDADLDNNGIVESHDYTLLGHAWLAEPGDLNWNPDADLDSDNRVDINDYTLMELRWFTVEPWD